jgi:hypothetical protein
MLLQLELMHLLQVPMKLLQMLLLLLLETVEVFQIL